jgi:hypothetical protein
VLWFHVGGQENTFHASIFDNKIVKTNKLVNFKQNIKSLQTTRKAFKFKWEQQGLQQKFSPPSVIVGLNEQ